METTRRNPWKFATILLVALMAFGAHQGYEPLTDAWAQEPASESKAKKPADLIEEDDVERPKADAPEDPFGLGQEVLKHNADVLTRATPPAAAQSRFKFKTKDGTMTVSLFQPGVSFTLEEGVLSVEDSQGRVTAAIGTASGGVLLVQQGETMIECANFVRLKYKGTDLLHVSVTGGVSPLAQLRTGDRSATGETLAGTTPRSPTVTPTSPAVATPPSKSGVPPKVKIVD